MAQQSAGFSVGSLAIAAGDRTGTVSRSLGNATPVSRSALSAAGASSAVGGSARDESTTASPPIGAPGSLADLPRRLPREPTPTDARAPACCVAGAPSAGWRLSSRSWTPWAAVTSPGVDTCCTDCNPPAGAHADTPAHSSVTSARGNPRASSKARVSCRRGTLMTDSMSAQSSTRWARPADLSLWTAMTFWPTQPGKRLSALPLKFSALYR